MTLDADIVGGRCREIEQSLVRLAAIRAGGREAFLASEDARDVTCYRLLVGIEAALALCYHVSARQLHVVPEDYAGCFAGLERAGVIGPDLSARLRRMAQCRNLLVHVYWTIDYGRVFDLLEHDVEDLREFSRAVAALL